MKRTFNSVFKEFAVESARLRKHLTYICAQRVPTLQSAKIFTQTLRLNEKQKRLRDQTRKTEP